MLYMLILQLQAYKKFHNLATLVVFYTILILYSDKY